MGGIAGKKRRGRRASVVMMTLQNFAFDQFDYEEAELPGTSTAASIPDEFESVPPMWAKACVTEIYIYF